MSLRTRLVVTLVAIIALMAAPAIYASSRLLLLRGLMSEAQKHHGEAYIALGRLQTRLAEYDRLQRSFIVTADVEEEAAKDSALAYAAFNLRQLVERGYETPAGPAGHTLAAIEDRSRAIGLLVHGGEKTAATAAFDSLKPLLTEATDRISDISGSIDARAEADIRRASQISAAANTTTLIALGAVVFLAIGLGAWISRNMVQPVIRLRRAMAMVTGGSYQVPRELPYQRADEIGDVSRSFRTMTTRLAELDKLRAEFMSISTHELKTPINVISGYSELLHEGLLGPLTPRQEEALASVREQIRVLTVMVNQLLDVSRLEAGGLRLEIGDVQLAEVFERVHRTFQALARKQAVALRVELAPDAPATIPGDADRLRDQVLGNIVSNAFKFTPEGGTVAVQGRGEGAWLLIDVTDTGSGIAADQLPHIFDKFYQVGEHARRQGSGLGLTIAHEIVTAHGGAITVDSTPGRGTRFHIRLPATTDPALARPGEHQTGRTPGPLPTGA